MKIKTIKTGPGQKVHYQVLSGTAEQKARQFLMANTGLFQMEPDLKGLVLDRVQTSPGGKHVRFYQSYRGIRIYKSDIVISINHSDKVSFYMSNYHPGVMLDNLRPTISSEKALSFAIRAINKNGELYAEPHVELMILPLAEGHKLGYRVMLPSKDPLGDWEIFVDSDDGATIWINELTEYGSNKAFGLNKAFNPDPLTSAAHYYGTSGYVDNNDADHTSLNNERVPVNLYDLEFSGGLYKLNGPYVKITDFENPIIAPVTNSSANFDYNRSESGFEDVMAYYHIDAIQRYLQSMGFTNVQNGPIDVDTHGLNGADNSHYLPGTNRLAFGEGGVDDAEDADVIWHEYGHAIQHAQISGSFGYELRALGEGFGDYWAGSFSASISTWENAFVFTWDAGITSSGTGEIWPGRRLDENYLYDDFGNNALLPSIHDKGKIWSATLWDIHNDLGRNVTDKLSIQSHYYLNSSATMQDAADALFKADTALYTASHTPALRNSLQERGFLVPLGVSISGPSSLGFMETGWYTASLDGGYSSGTVGYQWYKKSDGASTWSSRGSGSNPHPEKMISTNFTLKVIATRGSETAEATKYITYNAGGGFDPKILILPKSYSLAQNHPNPFNPITTIKYELPEASSVTLVIYDLRGNEVTRWVMDNETAGYKRKTWNATDKHGNKVPAGVYLLKMTAESKVTNRVFSQTLKMVLIK
ncbi:MAG: M36 family metallopeptidase [Candidatus Marinimicrobia bacterium]|nr:M36 family metallopeptidase [Candidatus Neomarinimicrobiota bacterium]